MPDTRPNTGFARFVLIVNGAVPLVLLGWDAAHDRLGADPVNYALHTTGLIALIFLLTSLLVTPVRKITGLSWLVSFRRPLGLYAFWVGLLHFLIYFFKERDGNISAAAADIWQHAFLIYGSTALLLMLPLALTSTSGMVRRLGAKRWKLLHELAYPSAAVAVIHYFQVGKIVDRQKWVFVFAAALLLGGRFVAHYAALWLAGRPGRATAAAVPMAATAKPRFWKGPLKIARVFVETPDVRTFRLVSPDGGPLPFDYQPGQYLNVALQIDGRPVRRSYTIASSPTRAAACEITVKRESDGTASRHLHDLPHEGDLLNVSAPAGRFVFTGKEADGVVLVAGGVGITPMMAIIRYLTDRAWAGPIDLFFAVRTEADFIFRRELTSLGERFSNLHVYVTLTRSDDAAWTGLRGRLRGEVVREKVPDVARRIVYICGPDAMMDATRELFRDLGVPDAKVLTEAFVSPTGAVADAVEPEDADPQPLIAADGVTAAVTFARSNQTTPAMAGQSILELAEAVGLDLPFECRSGTCGTCKLSLTSGRVVMEVQDALTAADRAAGRILACQAMPAGDVVVDA